MDERVKNSPRGETTRDALLDAATVVFARAGFGAANLREIAEAADVNPALIGYHFHSKEGLYLAVFERMVAQIRLAVDPVLQRIEQVLAEPATDAPRALELVLHFMETMLVHIVHEHPAWGELFVRETQSPTAAFELLYQGLMVRGHRALSMLVQRLRQGEDPAKARLLAATIFSQVLVIRISRTPLIRLMGWDGIGNLELEALKTLVRRNTTLLVLGD